MRVLGLGSKGAKKFCGLMDMQVFVTQNTYDLIVNNMHGCVQTVTDKLFQEACAQEKQFTSDSQDEAHTTELTVSGDGTWKKEDSPVYMA